MTQSLTANQTPASVSAQDLVLHASQLVLEFERLLESERYLLSTGKASGMQAIADAKQSVVAQLQEHDMQLRDLFASGNADKDVAKLKTRMMQCQTDNKSNHSLVMLELKHVNKSLDLLRSVLKMNDLSLYSSRGAVTVKREQRRIGSA